MKKLDLHKIKKGTGFQLTSWLREYPVLKAQVGEVLIAGRKRVEKEMTRMRYHTGLLINEHVRLNDGRAAYGAKAILRLEKDFGIAHSELGRYAQFARAYPISARGRKLRFNLPWGHYRKLMVIDDEALRYKLTLQAEKNEWPFEEVKSRVRLAIGVNHEKNEISPLAPVVLGEFYTYQVVRPERFCGVERALLLDCGFSLKKDLSPFPGSSQLKEGAIAASVKTSRGYALRPVSSDSSALYTYKAYVRDVIDGDTLKVDFSLGFGDRKGETIRLSHIDCPEMNTPEGKAVKRFVETRLASCDLITVKSIRTRKEKWGRYLGEVFFQPKANAPQIYLNQLLLDKGHAVRIRH